MPGGFPLTPLWTATTIGAVNASTTNTPIAAGATANTLGSWTQLTSGTLHAAHWATVTIGNGSATGANYAVNFGLGTPGNETPILGPIYYQTASSANSTQNFQITLPFSAPPGSAISAQCQCTASGSPTCNVAMQLLTGSFNETRSPSGVDTLGFTSSTTSPIVIDPGGVINTKGAWTIIAAAPHNYSGFLVAPANQSGTTVRNWLLDIGLGTGTPNVVLPDVLVSNLSTGIMPNATDTLWLPVAAGTQIQARCQCTITSPSSRTLGIILYAIRA